MRDPICIPRWVSAAAWLALASVAAISLIVITGFAVALIVYLISLLVP